MENRIDMELMYDFGKRYRTDIATDLVNRSAEIFANDIVKSMVERCVDL